MSGAGIPHHAENDEHKRIGIIISVIAVIMAVVAALAKGEANTMIVKEVQASNGYAWYQSKRQRSYVNELELKRIEFDLAGTPGEAQRKLLEEQRAKLKAKNAEYESENKGIVASADADKKIAETAAHKHHWFEYGEIMLHIAVVLCSLTLLTDLKLFYKLGLAATVCGIVLAAYAHTLKPHATEHAPTAGNTAAGAVTH
ncbi:MAG: DUF4337 domain-containing protein [Verrucomicrobia bacterium]|nr:DUF4337 domain-containing protein [Verrucomicrobiota bacterium]